MRIAVFDLDGTITRRDTFPPYLRGWLRRHPRAGFRRQALACGARFMLDRDRGRLKSDLLRAGMGGATAGDVRDWTAEFVAGLSPADFLPGALPAIARHRAAGDRLVLLSASVDLYVPEIGRRLGFDETICTEVLWRDGRLDGKLASPNRRAEEKLRCVERLRGRFPGAALTAYGNARSDFPHLKSADDPVLVNAGAGLRRAAGKIGIQTTDWRNNPGAGPVKST
jgi:HAD superfamily hydrolase (TIGR01490 family)